MTNIKKSYESGKKYKQWGGKQFKAREIMAFYNTKYRQKLLDNLFNAFQESI